MPTSVSRDQVVSFRPSRVEGAADVDEVRVYSDRLELRSSGKWQHIPLLSLARGREISSGRAPVGELYFSKTHYPDSHFVFYTTPRLLIYMPTDGPTGYPDSHFWRVQAMLINGGLKLYDEGPPKSLPPVLNPRPSRTVVYVLAVFALGWLYALAGFLPSPVGVSWQQHLLSNPSNPHILVAFTLPAYVMVVLVAFMHGRTWRALIVAIALSYTVAMIAEWTMRYTIREWAPLEQAPFNFAFWSIRNFVGMLLTMTVFALVGKSWRSAYLEPISKSEI